MTIVEKLNEFVDKTKELVQDSPQMDEANTKRKIIEPFLELLGWDIISNAELEYSIQIGSQDKKIDYALLLKGTPVAFVETKGLGHKLTDHDQRQLASYMHFSDNVKWGLLANGREFIIFKYTGSSTPDELGRIKLDDMSQDHLLIRALSKSSIEDGKSDEIADNIRERRKFVAIFNERKDELSEALTEKVDQLLDEEIPIHIQLKIKEQSKEMIDRVVQNLKENEQGLKSHEDQGKQQEQSNGLSNQTVNESNVAIVGNRQLQARNQAELMVEVIEHLILDHNLQEHISIPYGAGRSRYLLNEKPIHQDKSKMISPKHVLDQYYVETNQNKEKKKENLRRLAKECGVNINVQM